MGNFGTGIAKQLRRDRASQALHRESRCLLARAGPVADRHPAVTCMCGGCLLARSILRGQRLTDRTKKKKYRSVDNILMTTQLLIGHCTTQIVPILFFSFSLCSPFILTHAFPDLVPAPVLGSTGFVISRVQIVDAITQSPHAVRSAEGQLIVSTACGYNASCQHTGNSPVTKGDQFQNVITLPSNYRLVHGSADNCAGVINCPDPIHCTDTFTPSANCNEVLDAQPLPGRGVSFPR